MSSSNQSGQGSSNTGALHSIDDIVAHIVTANPNQLNQLNHSLRSGIPRDMRDHVLSGALQGGQDPLTVLDPRANTLGMLYIMCARISSNTNSPVPSASIIRSFCYNFSPEQARLAPDRVSALAKGIHDMAISANDPTFAIEPLLNLLTRYPPDSSYLTTIHTRFVLACLTSNHLSSALPVLSSPITSIDTNLCPDLHYNDNLLYHYTGGVILAALKRWSEAEEFFEICASSPGQVPAAIQMEAFKKLALVRLISKGKTSSPPKYTHPTLIRLFKGTVYNEFINHYPHQTDQLRALVEKNIQVLTTEKNLGLITQALDRAPRWSIKKLTNTYLTLGLAEIGKAVKIDNENDVRDIILSMTETSEISAKLSASGTVTFFDPPSTITKAQVDGVLHHAQRQSEELARLEMNVAKSREYLSKAVKSRDDNTGWAGSIDNEELLFSSLGTVGNWAEDLS